MIKHAYIHIPFCIRKCRYCSFISGFNIKRKNEYLNALFSEITKKYNNEELSTIYFGGGTPSLLEIEDLNNILSYFKFNDKTEITIEINPETADLEKLINLRENGFNRISLGVQTFNNEILKLIGRNHSEEIIYNSINNIKKAGFENFSIDLIYGLPTQTIENFKTDLNKAIQTECKNISSYGLKIEENSYFGKNTPTNLPNEDMQAEMFLLMCNILKENNFEHYEISNFAKKGFYSNHNCAYWKNKNYYGFGLNASGYEKNIRYKNISNFNEYIKNPLLLEEEEILTEKETMENEIFLALRLKSGVNIEEINKKYNINFEKKYSLIIEKYKDYLVIKNNHCKLTEKGILISNDIMSEFID